MTSNDLISKFPEIRDMEPFKKFVDEGRAEGLRTSVQIQGREKFGAPNAEQEAALKGISDPTRLEVLIKKILTANTWDELLAGA